MGLSQMVPKRVWDSCVDCALPEMTTYQKRGDRPTNSTNTGVPEKLHSRKWSEKKVLECSGREDCPKEVTLCKVTERAGRLDGRDHET